MVFARNFSKFPWNPRGSDQKPPRLAENRGIHCVQIWISLRLPRCVHKLKLGGGSCGSSWNSIVAPYGTNIGAVRDSNRFPVGISTLPPSGFPRGPLQIPLGAPLAPPWESHWAPIGGRVEGALGPIVPPRDSSRVAIGSPRNPWLFDLDSRKSLESPPGYTCHSHLGFPLG